MLMDFHIFLDNDFLYGSIRVFRKEEQKYEQMEE